MVRWRLEDYQLGRVVSGPEIERNGRHVKDACPICGKVRFVRLRYKGWLCGSCATTKSHKDNPRIGRQENHYNWKGGINLNGRGYIVEYVNQANPFYPMASNTGQKRFGGYILQHRLVMARHLGRCLESYEIVHYINGNKTDNRIENLNMITRGAHRVSYQDGFRDGYRKAMKECGTVWGGEDWKEA